MPLEKNHFYRFGSFRLDPAKRLLLRGQKSVPLMPKAFDTLLVLVENRDRMVAKEELMKCLWPDSFVEEANIAQNVAVLRKALGDSPEEHRYIVTIPGRGYRFAAKVNEEMEEDETDLVVERHSRSRVVLEESALPKPGSTILVTPSTLLKHPRNRILGVVAMAAVALIGATFLLNVAKTRDRLLGLLRHARVPARTTVLTTQPFRSIAILPLENLSGDREQDYFAEGMTDELTTDLAQFKDLRVISRTSAMHYKGTNKTSLQIGKELGVDTLIEGTVERVGDRVRIRAQLIDCLTDGHLWAKSYDREFKDVLALQSDIARDIVEQTQGNVSPQSIRPYVDLRPVNASAYEAYLKGRYFWNKRTPEGFQQAVESFQQAIAKDPNYARAYSGLADTHALISSYSLAPPDQIIPKARAAALRALQIDERLAEAHASLALVTENYDWDWQTAEKEYQRAIELDPNYATAYHWYAEFLAFQGRFDRALTEMQHARLLDPLSLIMAIDNAAILYYARQYDRAIEQYRAVLAMEPGFGHAHIAIAAYVQKGQFADALAEIEGWRRSTGGPWSWGYEAYVRGRAGQMARARYALEKFRETNRRSKSDPVGMFALAYTGMGNKDEAFAWLQKAFAEHSIVLLALKVDPAYDPLRSDPRFHDLLRRLGFTQ
jgi:TolB-like protein/DNA-binding winged helix-turn-helix (wHTH) protein/Tfp pilus assembly protein PilF